MKSHAWTFLLLMSSLLVAGCGRDGANDPENDVDGDRVEVEVVRLERSQITQTLETVGTLLPAQGTTIVAEVDGVIRYLPESDRRIEYEEGGETKSFAIRLDIGTFVDEGEELVKLDQRDAELELEQAQARLDLVQRKLEDLLAWRRGEEIQQLEAQVQQAQAAHDLAAADLTRSEQLMDRNASSAGEHDALHATDQQTRAALAEAEAALALAKAGPTPEQIAVARSELKAAEVDVRKRERELEKTVIHCPYPAVVTDRYVGVGDRVTAMPRVEIMKIADPRMLFAEIDVPERYLGSVELGDIARVRAAGVNEPLHGKVELINGRVDIETRTFRLRIGLDNRQGQMMPGGFVRASLPIASADDALVVPRTAVSFAEGQPAVFVFRADEDGAESWNGRVVRRPVELGIINRDRCEISRGLEAGEMVVLTNPALLADGMLVRLNSTVRRPAKAVENVPPTALEGHRTRPWDANFAHLVKGPLAAGGRTHGNSSPRRIPEEATP
jgi:HlyD family secretion protein